MVLLYPGFWHNAVRADFLSGPGIEILDGVNGMNVKFLAGSFLLICSVLVAGEGASAWVQYLDISKHFYGIDNHIGAENNARKALTLAKEIDPLNEREMYEKSLLNLLSVFLKNFPVRGIRYPDAMPVLVELAELYRKMPPAGQHPKYASCLNALGFVSSEMGRFQQAETLYRQSLSIRSNYAPVGHHPDYATSLNNLGCLLYDMGAWEEAEPLLLSSLAIQSNLSPSGRHPLYIASVVNQAIFYDKFGLASPAERWFKLSLEYYKNEEPKGRHPAYIKILASFGMHLMEQGRLDEAGGMLAESERLAQANGMEYHADMIPAYSALGRLSEIKKKGNAYYYYNHAIALARQMEPQGRHPLYANTSRDLGMYFQRKTNHISAYIAFEDSIRVYEQVRTNVSGYYRREYFASIMDAYQSMILSSISMGDYQKAFETRELSSAKYLKEKLAEKHGTEPAQGFDATNFPERMGETEIVLGYANTDRAECVILTVDRGGYWGVATEITGIIDSLLKKYTNELHIIDSKQGLGTRSGRIATQGKESGLHRLIQLYRYFLQDKTLGKDAGLQQAAFREVSAALYAILIKPVEAKISGKKKLLILPDGALGFLPFESLIGSDGRYLVEKYDIGYSFSLGVRQMIAARRRQHDPEKADLSKSRPQKVPFLGFGGAVYYQGSYQADMGASQQIPSERLHALISRGRGNEAYRNLLWDNLPGTIQEVREIHKVTGGIVLTNADVSEGNLKRMSQSGELRKHAVLHFATHGLLVPEVPELSALVMSLGEEIGDAEDGYLQTGEILKLDLDCDFVNLSACETGLGKIVKGEGIVGLTQAFLLAGVRSLSASLWQVDDMATMAFMVGVYSLVKEKQCGYREAITEMKRRFIRSSNFSTPFYWSPFVHYGE